MPRAWQMVRGHSCRALALTAPAWWRAGGAFLRSLPEPGRRPLVLDSRREFNFIYGI